MIRRAGALAALAVALSAPAAARQAAPERIDVCLLADQPVNFRGRDVSVEGMVQSDHHDLYLWSPRCPSLAVFLGRDGYGQGTEWERATDPVNRRRVTITGRVRLFPPPPGSREPPGVILDSPRIVSIADR
ncbi:hypothetical protein OF829_02325 [Sphingomonas sp. LB-2]|uniref:hypothetical protein n=1 Tax=Sphingomonas caeni TaxID=2984949 RepID=UPI0022302731|nr:hypothetical protein [Sphingomonas caeni]MCW3846057.1 hypothetical protein [Sphingomonas caeni]